MSDQEHLSPRSQSLDLIGSLVRESESYLNLERMLELLETGQSLAALPMQPLYMGMRASDTGVVAKLLPRLSTEQRQALVDLDIWKKEAVDTTRVGWILEVYQRCPDERIRGDFAQSEDFLLIINRLCVISTFDLEEPFYPEHEHFFLTPDQLLLVEYPEHPEEGEKLEYLVKEIYRERGVEYGYAYLFKMVGDSYMHMEEENYRFKTERLRDLGFVDYYEALEMMSPFPTREAMEAFVKKTRGATGPIELEMRLQALHVSALSAYQEGLDDVRQALGALDDTKRVDFLHFNFIRLVNATLALDEALQRGSIQMSLTGKKTRQRLGLGFAWMLAQQSAGTGSAQILKTFTLHELTKIGHTLLDLEKKRLKKALTHSGIPESFLGAHWNSFIEPSLTDLVALKGDGSTHPLEIRELSPFYLWREKIDHLLDLLPVMKKFYETFEKLTTQGILQDAFYRNYTVEALDIEALMLSSVVLFGVQQLHPEIPKETRLGIKDSELVEFYHAYFKKHKEEYLVGPKCEAIIQEYAKQFGLNERAGFVPWMLQLMVEQMNGYEIDQLSSEDYKHLGGPLILV